MGFSAKNSSELAWGRFSQVEVIAPLALKELLNAVHHATGMQPNNKMTIHALAFAILIFSEVTLKGKLGEQSAGMLCGYCAHASKDTIFRV